jgi:uncharacterized MnhB-related membrane protein
MNRLNPLERGYESRIRTSTLRLAQWNGLWLVATFLMAFGPKFLWNKASGFTLLAVGLDLAVGVGLIRATKQYILELDELQQKVHLNALGMAVGVGLVVGVPYSVMDAYDVIPFEAEIGHLIMIMGVTFLASYVYGARRYR